MACENKEQRKIPNLQKSQLSKNPGNSHSRWFLMHFGLGSSRLRLQSGCSQGDGWQSRRRRERCLGTQLSSLLPTAALHRSPVPGGSDSGRYLTLKEMALALMYSDLLPGCAYGCPTLWVCVGRRAFLGLAVPLKRDSCFSISHQSQYDRWY